MASTSTDEKSAERQAERIERAAHVGIYGMTTILFCPPSHAQNGNIPTPYLDRDGVRWTSSPLITKNDTFAGLSPEWARGIDTLRNASWEALMYEVKVDYYSDPERMWLVRVLPWNDHLLFAVYTNLLYGRRDILPVQGVSLEIERLDCYGDKRNFGPDEPHTERHEGERVLDEVLTGMNYQPYKREVYLKAIEKLLDDTYYDNPDQIERSLWKSLKNYITALSRRDTSEWSWLMHTAFDEAVSARITTWEEVQNLIIAALNNEIRTEYIERVKHIVEKFVDQTDQVRELTEQVEQLTISRDSWQDAADRATDEQLKLHREMVAQVEAMQRALNM